MEDNSEQSKQAGYEEEYVLLDLDEACVHGDIPANAPYVLSGLDTLNPTLVIGDRLKLIGEYQETIGTCYIFSESDSAPAVVHPEAGPSESNLTKEICLVNPNQAASKEVKPVASLHKVLKFRLATEDQNQMPQSLIGQISRPRPHNVTPLMMRSARETDNKQDTCYSRKVVCC